MARSIEFDRSESVRSALFLFWRQGYLATSLVQLLDAMNISRSSFYATFKDKKSLFIEVLEQYNHGYEALLRDVAASDSPGDAIARYINYSLKPESKASVSDGCLMVNTLLELSDIDDELADLASTQLVKVEKAFTSCFTRAIKAKKLGAEYQPSALAKLFMTFNQGVRVSGRRGATARQLKAQADLFSSLICEEG